MNKKIFSIMFCIVLLAGTVTAFEFDNVRDYDENLREFKVTNAFGLGKDIAKITLISDSFQKVSVGYNKVAEFRVEAFDSYDNAFQKVSLYDRNNDLQEFSRDFDYKYKTFRVVEVDDYGSECITLKNQSESCSWNVIGSHSENQVVWEDLTNSNFNNGDEYIIGIFTEVEFGDSVEWIPTFYGFEIDEWAVWDASLNVGLIAYWKFDSNDGNTTAIDAVGGIANGTYNNNAVTSQYAKIGNSVGFDGHDDNVVFNELIGIPDHFNMNSTFATSYWISANTTTGAIISATTGVCGGDQYNYWTSNFLRIAYDGEYDNSAWTPTQGQWYHVVISAHGSNKTLYVDGVFEFEYANSGTWDLQCYMENAANRAFSLGAEEDFGNDWHGYLDEFGIWNRTLTQAEITQLYNGGAGIQYTTNFDFAPTFILNEPVNYFNTTSSSITFNYTAHDDGIVTNVSLYIDDVLNLTTVHGTSNFSNLETILTLADGNYNWSVKASDNATPSQQGVSSTRFFSMDTISPDVDITSPTGNQGNFFSGKNLTLAWTTSDLNPQNCFYDYGGSNTTITCSLNSTNLTVTQASETKLVFYANDSFGNLNSSTTSWTYSFSEENVTFNQNVSETSSQFFEINITTDLIVLSLDGELIYNGTAHRSTTTCLNSNCSLRNTIDIPLVNAQSQINQFFWNLTIFNGSDSLIVNTTVQDQNVSKIFLEQCDATFTTETLNFTAFDEQNLSRITPYKFDGTFDFWLGTGSVFRNNSFSQNVTEMTICLQPNSTMKTSAIINYNEALNTSTYTGRFYYFDQHQISNVTQLISLYLLQSSASTSFILKVQDESLLPVVDAFIEIHRFYPGTNEFRIVQIAETDDNGKSIGFFQTETVDYKFIIKKNGATLLETGLQKVIPESSPFTLTFNTGADLGAPWASQEGLPLLISNLTWDDSTETVSFIYIDTSTNFTQGKLIVQQISLTNSTAYITVCNETSALSSATLTCSVGNSSGFYIASAYITRSAESLVQQISFQIETLSGEAGLLGLFFGFFLILIASFMFKFNEVAGIWATTIAVFLINIMGLIKFGGAFVTAIIGIAIILTWVLEK